MKKGLTSRQVVENREKFGTNKLPEKKMKTGLQFFMETFKDHINQILLAMMIVFTVIAVFGQGSYSEPIGVAVVLLAIALLGMNIGLKSQKSEKELRDRTSVHYCNVVRDGKIEHINTDDLVVGDLVIVQSGEAIYADGYLVEGNLKVDNSVLNGESEPCKKSAWNKGNPHIEIGGKRKANSDDYVNDYALFSGTTVVDGEGKMIVTNVGVNTVNGQTISTIDEIEETKTSLEIQLEDLAKQISKFGYIGASIIVVALIITNIIQYGGVAEYFGIGWIGVLKNILTIAVTALTIIVAAVQILVINIVMDSLNSLSFGGEPAKEEYMKEKPIPKGSKLLSKETVSQIAVSVVAFIGIFGLTLLPAIQNIFGNNEEVYATARFALLVMMATFNGFNIRTDGFNLFKGIGKNKLFVEIAIAIFAITFLLAQFGGEIMGCTAMTPTQWGVTIALAFLIIPIDLVRKAIIRRK